jgi:hypothetical protein
MSRLKASALDGKSSCAHFDDAFARFLPDEPNIRTLKRGREGM